MRDNMNNYGYVQVTMTTMLNRETEDREYAPLEMIKITILNMCLQE